MSAGRSLLAAERHDAHAHAAHVAPAGHHDAHPHPQRSDAHGHGHTHGSDGDAPLACDRGARLAALVRQQLALLGEDPEREGLRQTPARVARSLAWLTRGYAMDAADAIGDALFTEAHRNMVLVRDIEFYSMCEHHMLPFFGHVHVAYVPDGRIVGLSKLPRVVEVYARRLQVQERLTEQLAGALEEVLRPRGVGVVIEAVHLCMMMRGVEKQSSRTFSSALRGTFRDDPATRNEFLQLIHHARREP